MIDEHFGILHRGGHDDLLQRRPVLFYLRFLIGDCRCCIQSALHRVRQC